MKRIKSVERLNGKNGNYNDNYGLRLRVKLEFVVENSKHQK